MSIYIVPLAKWYPIIDSQYCKDYIESFKCYSCGDRVKYNKAWGHHSLPFGYGDVFCNYRCATRGIRYNKNKELDKRQQRKFNRMLKKCEELL